MLHVAARDNSVRCVEAILSRAKTVHVEVDALATEHRQTPLMTAAAHGHVDIVRLLVDAGAEINRQTAGCSTALIVACHYGHVDCVHLLLGQSTLTSHIDKNISNETLSRFITLFNLSILPQQPSKLALVVLQQQCVCYLLWLWGPEQRHVRMGRTVRLLRSKSQSSSASHGMSKI